MAAPEDFKKKLANLILERRNLLRISQREFARRAKIPSHSTITSFEKMDYLDYPERETLEKIANNIFLITIEDFMALLESSLHHSEFTVFGKLVLECEKLNSEEECFQLIKLLINRIESLKSSKA